MSGPGSSSTQKSIPQVLLPAKTQEDPEEILADKDINVRDPILPISDLHRAVKNALEQSTLGSDIMNICQSRLVSAVVPQVPHFPEVVEWCSKNYLSDKRVIMSSDGTRVVIKITPEAIASMLHFPQEETTVDWDEEKVRALYIAQTAQAQQDFLMGIFKEKKLIAGPPYPIESFTAAAIVTISMISQVLGLASAFSVTESHLGALLFLSSAEESGQERRVNFCKQLSDDIDRELQNFHLTRTFRYQAYLIHLFLYQQFSFMGHLFLEMVGADHKVKPAIDWCPRIRSTPENEDLWWYINNILPLLYTLIHDGPPPRVIPEMDHELQCTPQLATGDWFLYEDHTIIRVYGFEGTPFKLPAFITPRIFALEFLRQKLACDDLHFSDGRLAKTFRIPTDLGSFFVKSRKALSILEGMLNKMKFPPAGSWKYDPRGIILRMKDPAGTIPVAENPYHQSQPVIERLANKRTFLQTKVSLDAVERSLVLREKRPGEDLTEEMPEEKRSRTEEDLEKMMEIFHGKHSGEPREVFKLQGPDEVVKEAGLQVASTSGSQPLVTVENIYEKIRASGREHQRKEEEEQPDLPDSRLLSAFNMESGQLRMALLQSTKPKGEIVSSQADYKATEVHIDMTQIHYKDMIQLHQQSSNILYRDLTLQHTTTHKLRKSLESITTQYRMEKVATQAKNVRIRVLEKALLDLSEDPGNDKHVHELLKEKDKEIALLKKKLKIPGTYPTTIEEVSEALKEKQAETQKLIESEERNHGYMAQISYLTGKLQSLSSERILSPTERVAAEAEQVSADKALAVQLQEKLNDAEVALAALREEQRRSRHKLEEQDQLIAKLEVDLQEYKDSPEGLDGLIEARARVWKDIWDVVTKNWSQLLKYQELQEQVVSANLKLKQFDREMEGKAEVAKDIVKALEDLPAKELEIAGVHNRIYQLTNVHKVLQRIEFIEKTRSLSKELSQQCFDYRARFDKCVRLGLPCLFSGSSDIYEEAVYLHQIEVIMKDESVFKSVSKHVRGKDINQILKGCFELLSSLKTAFKPKNPPQFAKGAELCLIATTAEEYKYPLLKEWQVLLSCLKIYKRNTQDPLAESVPQQGTSQPGESSKGKKRNIAVKSVMGYEDLLALPDTSAQDMPDPSLHPSPPLPPVDPQQAIQSPRQSLRFTIPLQSSSQQAALQQPPSTQPPRKQSQPKQAPAQRRKAASKGPPPPKGSKK